MPLNASGAPTMHRRGRARAMAGEVGLAVDRDADGDLVRVIDLETAGVLEGCFIAMDCHATR